MSSQMSLGTFRVVWWQNNLPGLQLKIIEGILFNFFLKLLASQSLVYIVSGLTGFYKHQKMGICSVNSDRTIALLSSTEFNLATQFPVFLIFYTFNITTYKKRKGKDKAFLSQTQKCYIMSPFSKKQPKSLVPFIFSDSQIP